MNNGLKKELEFHKRNQFRQSDRFLPSSIELFSRLGLSEDSLKGKKVLDVGCGSRLRTAVFSGVDELHVIDPLAIPFIRWIEWSDLDTVTGVFGVPGEKLIHGYMGYFDAVVSVNAIDHGDDWRHTIENIFLYLKPEGHFYLYVDVDRKKEDSIHSRIYADELNNYLSKYFLSHADMRGELAKLISNDSDNIIRIDLKGFDTGCNMAMYHGIKNV